MHYLLHQNTAVAVFRIIERSIDPWDQADRTTTTMSQQSTQGKDWRKDEIGEEEEEKGLHSVGEHESRAGRV